MIRNPYLFMCTDNVVIVMDGVLLEWCETIYIMFPLIIITPNKTGYIEIGHDGYYPFKDVRFS